jgi:broad specificity phosphatase PhoE
MKTRIYLVRHGESEYNVIDIVSGQVNPGLTELGQEQAKKARHKFKHVNFDHVYTSDLTRAVHTAELLTEKPVHSDNRLPELRERNYGALDGGSGKHLAKSNEIKQRLSDEEAWHHKNVPDMESDHELAERYMAILEKLAKAHPGETLLIVSHGTAIRTLLRRLLNLSPHTYGSGTFPNIAHAIVDYEDGKFMAVEYPPHS